MDQMIEGPFDHLTNLKKRLDLIEYIQNNQEIEETLSNEHLIELWQLFVTQSADKEETNYFYRWLTNADQAQS